MRISAIAAALCLTVGVSTAAEVRAAIKESTHIAPQALEPALHALAKTRGLQIVYRSEVVGTMHTRGAEGQLTTDEALRQLLNGTGLTFEFLTEDTVTIVPNAAGMGVRTPLPSAYHSNVGGIRVASSTTYGQANESSTAPKETSIDNSGQESIDTVTVFGRGVAESVREIPQTTDVYGLTFIQTIQADVIDDVLRFVPNSFVSNGSPPLYTSFMVRGFPASQTYNGLGYQFSSNARAPANMVNVERVEVLKGPAGVLYGTMEPGAIVNIVTKLPPKTFQAEGSVKYGTYNDSTLTFDIGGPLSERVGARLSMSYSRTDTALDHVGPVRDIFIAPVVKFDISDATSLTVDGYYDNYYWPNGFADGRMPLELVGSGLVPSTIGRFPQSTNFQYDERITGANGYGDLEETRKGYELNARLKHDFTDELSFNAVASYHHDQRYEETIFTQSLAADNRTLSRLYWVSDDPPGSSYIAHLDLRGAASTGPLQHKWVVGLDYNDAEAKVRSGVVRITPIDIFAPVYGTIVLPSAFPLRHVERRTTIADIFLQDRISLNKWSLLLGVRRSDYEEKTEATPFGGTLSRSGLKDTIWSSQFGILYDATDWMTLFASRNESFVPRRFINSQGSQVDDPETSVQYEVGAKFDLLNSGLTANLTYFMIEKNDVLVADPANPQLSVPIGQVTSDGIEASIEGRPAEGLTLMLGYGYNITEISKADQNQGNRFADSPKHTASVFSRYDIQSGPLAGLGISGSINYVGARWSTDDNLIEFPSYTRFDLGLYIPVTERAEFSIYGQNLSGAKVLEGIGAGQARYTEDRTVFGKVAVRF
jgi:iron complex outermembrane receptor protein